MVWCLLLKNETHILQPNPTLKRDAPKAARPLALRYASSQETLTVGSDTLDTELPFRMIWEGSVLVRADRLQGFALIAQFTNAIHGQRIRISIHA